MRLVLQRYSDNGNSTQGLMFSLQEGEMAFESYALEDESRAIKVPGETCIPAGLYEVAYNEILTPKTIQYREQFDWFTWHLQILNVPDFDWIYIHIGNKESDTDGCVTVQDAANNNQIENGFNGKSHDAFKRIYSEIGSAFANGEKVFIEVRDINYLL